MNQLWTLVLRDGGARAMSIRGRERAIDAACQFIAEGVVVRLAAPIAIADERDVIGESELRRIAGKRGMLPKRCA